MSIFYSFLRFSTAYFKKSIECHGNPHYMLYIISHHIRSRNYYGSHNCFRARYPYRFSYSFKIKNPSVSRWILLSYVIIMYYAILFSRMHTEIALYTCRIRHFRNCLLLFRLHLYMNCQNLYIFLHFSLVSHNIYACQTLPL